MAVIPALEYTPIEKIPEITGGVRKAFLSHKTRSVEFRLVQLRKLYWGLRDNRDAIFEACKKDIGKGNFETALVESSWCENDIVFVCNNLEKWVKDEKAPDLKLLDTAFSPRIRKEPLGTVLVIGAYNFPIQLSLGPVIGAIAAGCTVVLKPSENAPNCAVVMAKIMAESLDPSCYTTIQGAVPETTAVLDQKWDKIFYTGGVGVGTIIAKKAAETLTPVCLELGGRNPAIITKNADPRLAARRLMWAKTLNAGQVCVSQNYIMVDREIMPAFIEQVRKALSDFYPNGVEKSPDYGRIVNKRQFDRLKTLLASTKGKILIGGSTNESTLFFEPTVIQIDNADDPLLADESFGPLIPILAIDDLDTAIRIANEVHDTPLGVYAFGSKAETDKILAQTRSGGASVNDGYYHASIPTLAFGGVGSSGQGAYRGKASFDCFTHRRSVTTTPGWMESLLDVRYPPYSASKQKQLALMNGPSINFDRQGKVTGGWLWWLIGLGGKGVGSGLVRWAILVAFAYAAREYMVRTSRL